MERCRKCGRSTVQVTVRVADEMLLLSSCSACDLRVWERDGEVLDLTTVLDLTADANPPKSARRAKSEASTAPRETH